MIDTEIEKCCQFDQFLEKLDAQQKSPVTPIKECKFTRKAHSAPNSPLPRTDMISELQFSTSEERRTGFSQLGCPNFLGFMLEVKEEKEAGSANLVAIENHMNYVSSPVFWPKRRSQVV
ncbi:unnamed protein product [Soboliphyme baturini]|uniref:Ovule protein n=1 Tax=Soboliphyme baturini TaxID=241478 RepID=A0A183I9U7_9BILA|nr:unnamed protein product [Soboliphyme baturini]